MTALAFVTPDPAPDVLDAVLAELLEVCCRCRHAWAHELRAIDGPEPWFTLYACSICRCRGGVG